ncbi:MAG TPA: four helix bundle protein [Cryomorphaceae bacterium]|nr:four helix bundle protein [Cryomorphaceae bacterium]
MNKYRDLRVWQKSMDLVIKVYKLTKNFPDTEKFGLISQMNRSAVSVPSNIAEGAGRNNPKEFYQFLGIAKGSLADLETQLEISKRLEFQNNSDFSELFELTDHVGRMISKLQIAIKDSGYNNVTEPLELYNQIEK